MQNNSMSLYTNHPKPLTMSTCSMRKIGGTYVLQNYRLDRQRNDIQLAANKRRTTNSIMNVHHLSRQNQVRNSSTKVGSSKSNAAKRHATVDKIINDVKHVRFNDMNGFILHNDGNDTSEMYNSNNSIHDKITFSNLK